MKTAEWSRINKAMSLLSSRLASIKSELELVSIGTIGTWNQTGQLKNINYLLIRLDISDTE